MHKSLFDSKMGTVHYFVCPRPEYFYLNSLEKLDLDTYLFRLLRDEGYERIVMVRNTGSHWEVWTYDRLSYWSWEKPKEFTEVDTRDPEAVEQFCRNCETPQTLQGLQSPLGKAAPVLPRKTVPKVGKCVVESFAGSNEFVSFLDRVEKVLTARNLKTAVVMPVRIFDTNDNQGNAFLSALAANRFRAILEENNGLDNILVLTTDRTASLVQYVNEGRSRYWEIHTWASEIASQCKEPALRENAIVGKLTGEGRMVICRGIGEDEIANLLLRKKLVEGDPRFEKLEVSKADPLAERIEAQCKGRKQYFQALPFQEVREDGTQAVGSRMLQLEKCLEAPGAVEDLIEASEAMPGRIPERLKDLSPTDLSRVTGRIVPRSRRTQEEIEHTLNAALRELDEMTGLDTVKTEIQKIVSRIKRGERVLLGHFLFLGNPGTGKTVVARILGRILYALGITSRQEVVEVDRAKLVGAVIGDTEQKTLNWCHQALGGVLFVDEAYALYVADSEKDYGRNALNTIMKFMEDNRQNMVVIFAGYENKLDDMFKAVNPGYRDRFKYKLQFPDYNVKELCQIMEGMAEKMGRSLSEDFRKEAEKLFAHWLAAKTEEFGNARAVRNMIERADDNRALRIDTVLERGETVTEEQSSLLIAEDLPERAPRIQAAPEPRIPYRRIAAEEITGLPAPFGAEVCGDIVKLNAAAEKAVVKLVTDAHSRATAFLISPDGYALTCDHAIAGAKRIEAILRVPRPGCLETKHTCRVINTKSDLDMALIKLEGVDFPYLKLVPADRPIQKGENYLNIGYHWDKGTGSKLNSGIIHSGEEEDKNKLPYIQLTGNGFHGDSGSPVLALSDGMVIGVFTGSIEKKLSDGKEEIENMRPIRLFWEEFIDGSSEMPGATGRRKQ